MYFDKLRLVYKDKLLFGGYRLSLTKGLGQRVYRVKCPNKISPLSWVTLAQWRQHGLACDRVYRIRSRDWMNQCRNRLLGHLPIHTLWFGLIFACTGPRFGLIFSTNKFARSCIRLQLFVPRLKLSIANHILHFSATRVQTQETLAKKMFKLSKSKKKSLNKDSMKQNISNYFYHRAEINTFNWEFGGKKTR